MSCRLSVVTYVYEVIIACAELPANGIGMRGPASWEDVPGHAASAETEKGSGYT